jgi:putative hemolysin
MATVPVPADRVSPSPLPGAPAPLALRLGEFRLRLASTRDDLRGVMALRAEVLRRELGALATAATSAEADTEVDRVCHHLLVEDCRTGELVATCRAWPDVMASRHGSSMLRDAFERGDLPRSVLEDCVETGRPMVAARRHDRHVLFLLWRGMLAYRRRIGRRYLVTASDLGGLEVDAETASRQLRREGRPHARLAAAPPRPAAGGADPFGSRAVRWPLVLRMQLRFGAWACGRPVVDGAFRTVQVPILVDAEDLGLDARDLAA